MPDTLTGLANPPAMPAGVRVIRTLTNDDGHEVERDYPVRLLYAGRKDDIHHWTVYWHKWIEAGDRIEIDYLPAETCVQVGEAGFVNAGGAGGVYAAFEVAA
jgi:hypothetical protein